MSWNTALPAAKNNFLIFTFRFRVIQLTKLPRIFVERSEELQVSCDPCLVPRRLSRCARKGRREGDIACRLYPSHGPLRCITSHSFRARLCHAKNEAPEEEAAVTPLTTPGVAKVGLIFEQKIQCVHCFAR